MTTPHVEQLGPRSASDPSTVPGAAFLDDNWTSFLRLLDDCESALRRGHAEQAAVRAQVAATFAWCNHTGVFASARLEGLLHEIGSATMPHRTARSRDAGGRVLHVATQLYGTGGHSQMLANWLRSDPDRKHDVCLTAQQQRAVPMKVHQALGEGSRLVLLDDWTDTLLGRATALHDLAQGYATVVLHQHPNDVVPSIAFAGELGSDGPEVLLVDHADHVFWVGGHAAHRVVSLRRSGLELAATRRGIDPGRQALLLRPLDLRPRSTNRAEAKARLGLPGDRLLVVSAAAGFKYEPVDGAGGFLDVVLPAIRSCSEAFLVVAGPDADGGWATLESEGLGRAVGLLPDVRPLLEAADLYLDSYPFASLTSALEAAALGVPVMTYRPERSSANILGADTPELDHDMVVATTPPEYRSMMRELLGDDDAREALGLRTRAAVHRAQAGGAWATAVGEVIDRSRPASGPGVATREVRDRGWLDQRVGLVQRRTGGQGVDGAREVNAHLLGFAERVTIALRMVRAGKRPRGGLLMSAAMLRRARALRQQVGSQPSRGTALRDDQALGVCRERGPVSSHTSFSWIPSTRSSGELR